MSLTITATVGRNVGTWRADWRTWDALQRRVRNALTYATTGAGRTETHYGAGTWNGVAEESAAVTRYGTAWHPSTGADQLRGELGEIARAYHQEAIALVVGEGELIEPLPLPPTRHTYKVAGVEYTCDIDHDTGTVRRCSCNRADYGDPGHDGNRHAHALGDRGPTRQDSALADRVALDFT